MSNYPPRIKNTLDGLSEEAGDLYLRGYQRDDHRALFMASEWNELESSLRRIVALTRADPDIVEDLMSYLRERHFRRYFPTGRTAS